MPRYKHTQIVSMIGEVGPLPPSSSTTPPGLSPVGHWAGAGWFYNVAGLRAAELTVDGEGPLRVGTDEPETVKAAVQEAPPAG